MEDIDAIMEEMEAKTPKPADRNKTFDQFDAQAVGFMPVDEPAPTKVSDDVDAKSLWNSIFTKGPEKPGKIYTSKPTNERYYDFTHANLGFALIFNQMKIKGETERTGSRKDANDLKDVLSGIGFDVRVYNDLSVKEIRNELYSRE